MHSRDEKLKFNFSGKTKSTREFKFRNGDFSYWQTLKSKVYFVVSEMEGEERRGWWDVEGGWRLKKMGWKGGGWTLYWKWIGRGCKEELDCLNSGIKADYKRDCLLKNTNNTDRKIQEITYVRKELWWRNVGEMYVQRGRKMLNGIKREKSNWDRAE